jgi:hypothetical protein
MMAWRQQVNLDDTPIQSDWETVKADGQYGYIHYSGSFKTAANHDTMGLREVVGEVEHCLWDHLIAPITIQTPILDLVLTTQLRPTPMYPGWGKLNIA